MAGEAPQRQDSLIDQLRDLIPFANFHGMYDAADYLQGLVDRADEKSNRIVERSPMGGRRADFDPCPDCGHSKGEGCGCPPHVRRLREIQSNPMMRYCHE